MTLLSLANTLIRITALEQLQELAAAPSVGMHDVPRESVGEHLGFGKDDDESRDELDDRVARMSPSSPKSLRRLTFVQSTHGISTTSRNQTRLQSIPMTIPGTRTSQR